MLVLICTWYNESLNPGTSWQYQRTALYYQTAALVQDSDPVEDAEALSLIDPIFDVQACRQYSYLHDSDLRDKIVREDADLTQKDWNACVKGIVRLAVKYPGSLFRERKGVFLKTVGMDDTNSSQTVIFYGTRVLYEIPAEDLKPQQTDFLYRMAATWPIVPALRDAFIMSLIGEISVLKLSWNMLPSFVLLFIATIVLLLRRKWMRWLAVGALFVRIPLVFLTAPDSYFMYYLTPYIAGYTVTAVAVVWQLLIWRQKKGNGGY